MQSRSVRTQPPQVLQYRRPGAANTAPVTPQSIRQRLIERSGMNLGLGLLSLLGGLAATLIAPFIVASCVVYLGGWKVMSWSAWFLLLWVIGTAFLLWQEWRHRGHGASSLLESLEAGPASSYGELEIRRLTGFAAFLTELFLLGPRLILESAERLTAKAIPPHLDRAAEALYALSCVEGGVAPQALLREGETLAELAPVVAWLRRHEWVDLSARRDRVWMLSEARKRLA